VKASDPYWLVSPESCCLALLPGFGSAIIEPSQGYW
jgi:hypothetical protein